MIKLNVIVTSENDIFINEINKQLIPGDIIKFVELDQLPPRHLDALIGSAKIDAIVIINSNGPVPVSGFLNDFREAFSSLKTFLRRGDELMRGGFIGVGIEYIHWNDCVCFDKKHYRTQLRNINPFSDYKRCLTELALITNDVMVPMIRKLPDLTLLQDNMNGINEPVISEYQRIRDDAEESKKLKHLNQTLVDENLEDRKVWMDWMEEK
jgi:hypothetical protein